MSLTNYVFMLGSDYKAICDAIRKKTGLKTKLKSGEIASLIDTLTGKFDFLPLTEFRFIEDDYHFGLYCSPLTDKDFTLNEGETYIVEWDGIEYVCEYKNNPYSASDVEYENVMGLGDPCTNFTNVYGVQHVYVNSTSTGEPFYINIETSTLTVHTQSTATTHTLRIYQYR